MFPFSIPELDEDVYVGARNGTYTTVSRITLPVEAEDDGHQMACRADHPAMDGHARLEDIANLTVLCKSWK